MPKLSFMLMNNLTRYRQIHTHTHTYVSLRVPTPTTHYAAKQVNLS